MHESLGPAVIAGLADGIDDALDRGGREPGGTIELRDLADAVQLAGRPVESRAVDRTAVRAEIDQPPVVRGRAAIGPASDDPAIMSADSTSSRLFMRILPQDAIHPHRLDRSAGPTMAGWPFDAERPSPWASVPIEEAEQSIAFGRSHQRATNFELD